MVPTSIVSTLVVSVLGAGEISDSGRFERWSHFKDYGVPGTVNDPVNKAAIADGTCRLIGQRDGFFMWRDGARTQRVLDALAAAPGTDQPSHFVLETKQSLERACFDESSTAPVRPDYDVKAMAGSVQNWYHALCAPEEDASWAGVFDPAYQPQQMALTAGFMCIAACDASDKGAVPAAVMSGFSGQSGSAGRTRDAVCELFPWGSGTDFSVAKDLQQLSEMTEALQSNLCKCSALDDDQQEKSLVATSSAFADSGRFERWSHFKDYGVPGTVNDPVNKAAIADGTCRMLGQRDGFFMWRDGARTQRVLDALAAAPGTDRPSHFVLDASKALEQACFESGATAARPDYDEKSIAASVQNWYHALCAPEEDASWGGVFDPAYQPQQMALTAGFMYIAACDAQGDEAPDLSSLSESESAAQSARDGICAAFPWGRGTDFSAAANLEDLAKMLSLLTGRMCPGSSDAAIVV